jgi:hypothetical protein
LPTERWPLGVAAATVDIRKGVGTVRVQGLVSADALRELHGRIADWAVVNRPVGYVLVLGWPALLIADEPAAVVASLCGVTDPAVSRMAAAVLVPPERIRWAARHCRLLSEHGIYRAAFSNEWLAVDWVRRTAPLAQGAAVPESAPTAAPETAVSSRRRRTSPAARRTQSPVAGQGSLQP